jgi:hypothetical protein
MKIGIKFMVMKKVSQIIVACACLMLACGGARAADTNLLWDVQQNQVNANVQDWTLPRLLRKIHSLTGWEVWVEPGTTNIASAKFKGMTQDEALKRLLGRLNYFRDQTNGVSRLFVFQTAPAAAIEKVQPDPKKNYRIANEVLVKFKNHSTNSIDDLAKRLGAKIIARDDKIGFYRLQFPDGSTADSAIQTLNADPSVAQADANYSVDRPTPIQLTQTGPAAPGALFNLNPPTPNGPIVGLVDTAIINPPQEFQKYMLTPVSVVGNSEEPTGEPTHGTAMMETMLGSMASNPSKILPVDVYGAGESTTTYDVMEGVVAAINAGANPINLSLGGTGNSQMLGTLISEAQQKGIEFVAAAGNTPGTELTYPAAYPGVFAVTASGPNGQLASYADDGSFVKAMDSGTSTIIWNGGEWVVQGTSPATAAMTGSITALENLDHISPQAAAQRLSLIYPAPHQ